MSTTAIANKDATVDARVGRVDMKLEVITIQRRGVTMLERPIG